MPGSSHLKTLLSEFSRLSGLRAIIYDTAFFLTETAPERWPLQLRFHTSPICELMKSRPDTLARCVEVENRKVAAAGQKNCHTCQQCYAGVCDLVVPIRIDGASAGALMLGQVITSKKENVVRKIIRLGFSKRAVALTVRAMDTVSSHELKQHQPLLNALRHYVEISVSHERLLQKSHAFPPLHAQGSDLSPDVAIRTGAIPLYLIQTLKERLPKGRFGSVRQMLQIIAARYHHNISQRETATAVGLSEAHASREFKRATRMTFRACLLETRLNAAFYLIKHYRTTIEEASVLVGYQEGSTFLRAFKKFTKMTPRQYLKKYPRAYTVAAG